MRSLLTLLGVGFGILALVATIGLTATASARVSARFDALRATMITVDGFSETAGNADASTGLLAPTVNPDGLARADGLNGVVAAGTFALTGDSLPPVSKAGPNVPSLRVETPVMAATPGALAAFRVTPVQGRLFDDGHQAHRHPVALLGEIAARNLGYDRTDGQSVVFVAGRAFLVLGVVTTPDLDSQVPLSVVVPEWVSRDPDSTITFSAPRVVVQTRPGAAQQVGMEVKAALEPARPETLLAQVPPDPRGLRADVESDTRALFLLMAAVSLVIGAIGIGNTTLVAVLERRHEIGLRRAIGASRRSILVQFLLESSFLGLAGGIVGTVAGLDLTVAIALLRGWPAAIPPWSLAAGPLLGLTVGMVAGLYPAARAARIEPIEALSS